ncbi:MBL fold metallo-hydrolase [Amycolatopsis rhabdoformis]|uniref:MBL fold metallo-hydrolase n=1 Tax=Amycolatopsis rhabdoformis TaxID=1448059 RepID=A0ABZ1IHZ0_9PSEU|nr:MBL fold metallo-hydrolase [Amycolatopsis rhabdoformis]WSE34080.1 MBL fold metallo-hydrolase [Amycolatopsis rhabdoformis]
MTDVTVRVIGGPTAVVEYAGARFLLDPTFDEPQTYHYGPVTAVKLTGPAVRPDELGPIDAVLVSHEHHMDNFDFSGREFALGAKRVITTEDGAPKLGDHATGLRPFDRTEVGTVRITAVPALHGDPELGLRNGPVIGFVLEADGAPTVYIGGDNASLEVVSVIAERFPGIEIAVLNVGAAKLPARGDVFLTLTADLAARAAALLGARAVVPLHQDGWAHYTQHAEDVTRVFGAAGLGKVLVDARPGAVAVL